MCLDNMLYHLQIVNVISFYSEHMIIVFHSVNTEETVPGYCLGSIFSFFLSVTFRKDVTLACWEMSEDKYSLSNSSVASSLLLYLFLGTTLIVPSISNFSLSILLISFFLSSSSDAPAC